jgi:hypothetical protein
MSVGTAAPMCCAFGRRAPMARKRAASDRTPNAAKMANGFSTIVRASVRRPVTLQLRTGEEVRWVNEWRPPSEADKGRPQLLPGERRGFYVCPSCGRDLAVPDGDNTGSRGRQRTSRGDHGDPFGHAQGCDRKGRPPRPVAIVTRTLASTLRLLVDLPQDQAKAIT